MQDALITDPTFIREQWSQGTSEELFPETLPPAAGSITSLNGIPGPAITISGGTTGLAFSSGATPITLSGTLVVADGGTGRATLTNHGVLIGASTSAINITGTGTAGQVLTSNGAAADPTFQAGAAGTVTATGTLTANQLIIGNGGADEKVLGTLGTTVTVLHGNAGGAPTFAAVSLTADVSGSLPIANGGTSGTTVATAIAALGLAKQNSAAVAPTVNDDSSAGYSVNSLWTDTVLQDGYMCMSAAVGAAVWKKATP
jgi:hypothetical protein